MSALPAAALHIQMQAKQLKAMDAELSMYKQQVDVFKSDIEAATEAMRSLRLRWITDQKQASSTARGVSEQGQGGTGGERGSKIAWQGTLDPAADGSNNTSKPWGEQRQDNNASILAEAG